MMAPPIRKASPIMTTLYERIERERRASRAAGVELSTSAIVAALADHLENTISGIVRNAWDSAAAEEAVHMEAEKLRADYVVRDLDLNTLERLAIDAYSVSFEPSRKLVIDHQRALRAAMCAVLGEKNPPRNNWCVWFHRPGVNDQVPFLFVGSLPKSRAERVAKSLVDEGWASKAWAEEDPQR